MKTIRRTLIVLFLLTVSGWSQEVHYGNLSQLISQIRSAMPGQGSNAFVVPTTAQMDSFRAATNLVLTGQYHLADSLAGMMGYKLFEWYDTIHNNDLFYVLMEPNANQSGGVQLGWGTYIFHPGGEQEVIIEVPHPIWDTNTWKVGFAAYQLLNSSYFLMAGTHRYANGTNPRPADVAHNTQNMFHVVHQQTAPYCQHALQVHGFNRNNYPGYPDVVLSNGTANPGVILDSLATAIIANGYSVGIYDGIHWTNLGATTNKQGQWSNSQGYSFIHMELEYFIRASQSEWENILDALYAVFYLPVGIEPGDSGQLPVAPRLYPNYPNPFNPATTISFVLPKAGQVRLTIYNVQGQIVRRLANGWKTAGRYQIRWDGRDDSGKAVASGLYLLQMSSGTWQQSRKMFLLK